MDVAQINTYEGPERRKNLIDRRQSQCDHHAVLQQKLVDLKELQDKLENGINSKVSMKLFYLLIGLVVSILAFQWTTYERVNDIALRYNAQVSELNIQIQKMSFTVDKNQSIGIMKMQLLTNTVDKHIINTERETTDIKAGIKEVRKDIRQIKRGR